MDGLFRLDSGCFSRDEETNHLTAEGWGVARDRTYVDVFEMLDGERDRLDAVVVLTPVHAHASIIAACLELGYPVISEKPLSGSVSDCQLVADALVRYPRFFALTMNYTGYPMVRELRARIDRGDLGRVTAVRLTMQQEGFVRRGEDGRPVRPQAWRLIDGEIPTVSLDLGTHVIHLLRFITGCSPTRVISRMGSLGSFPEVVDDVDVLMETDRGPHVHAWWGKSAMGYSNGLSVEVFGDAGSARWVQMDPEFLSLRGTDGVEHRMHRGSRGCVVASDPRYNRFKAGHPDGFLEAFANCYTDIATAMRAGEDESPYVFGVSDGFSAVVALDAITRAARSPNWTSIEDLAEDS